MELNRYTYEEIQEKMVFGFDKIFSEEDMKNFAAVTGDKNPLHHDSEYAREKGFEDKVVYGLLAGSLFSALVGMLCPGEKNLYLSQEMLFRKPVYLNKKLRVEGEITEKIDSIRVIIIKTKITCDNDILISGTAKVKVI